MIKLLLIVTTTSRKETAGLKLGAYIIHYMNMEKALKVYVE